jgi:hypothetical protein
MIEEGAVIFPFYFLHFIFESFLFVILLFLSFYFILLCF